jgi:hypothetical protein
MKLSPIDHDALRRALDEAPREPKKAEQLARIEKHEGLLEAQQTVAYHCQQTKNRPRT